MKEKRKVIMSMSAVARLALAALGQAPGIESHVANQLEVSTDPNRH
jgi:hypothetical protein